MEFTLFNGEIGKSLVHCHNSVVPFDPQLRCSQPSLAGALLLISIFVKFYRLTQDELYPATKDPPIKGPMPRKR